MLTTQNSSQISHSQSPVGTTVNRATFSPACVCACACSLPHQQQHPKGCTIQNPYTTYEQVRDLVAEQAGASISSHTLVAKTKEGEELWKTKPPTKQRISQRANTTNQRINQRANTTNQTKNKPEQTLTHKMFYKSKRGKEKNVTKWNDKLQKNNKNIWVKKIMRKKVTDQSAQQVKNNASFMTRTSFNK